MSISDTAIVRDDLLATILSDESFRPAEPHSIEETGLSASLIESLIAKHLGVVGTNSGRRIADHVCLPFGILEDMFQAMRTRQIVVHSGTAPLNDYYYTLTEQGRERAQSAMEVCGYVGPAPVPLMDYVLSTEAQTIRAEAPKREQLITAFGDISIDETLFESLGPAINSGAGLFLYGYPGNGKSTLAKRITMCFGQQVWIPKTIVEDGQLIKLYDAACHETVETAESSIVKSATFDRRWIKVRRPTVVVGGELTMDNLEIRHDPVSNVSEAPLQMKSNCGCLLIDDFGRQRVEPTELLNRWIIPLENRYDYLTLSTGKKIQVPFEQLIIFSTNLQPKDLVDEAFLRRIPYKIEISDPTEQEFHFLFEIYAKSFDCEYRSDVVEHILSSHYAPERRPLRRCHPRDLLSQVRNYCVYNDLPMEMRCDHFDRVVKSYFTNVASCDG
jgi:predicted ATPase with chaperone activity